VYYCSLFEIEFKLMTSTPYTFYEKAIDSVLTNHNELEIIDCGNAIIVW